MINASALAVQTDSGRSCKDTERIATNGNLIPLTMSIRFPATDLPEVVARLRTAARNLDGRVMPGNENNDQPGDTPQG